MRVLIVDNNIDLEYWGAADLCRTLGTVAGTDIYVRRAPQGDLPRDLSRYDKIIVSGSKTSVTEDSPWISAQMEFLKTAVDSGKPVLGVCYGHQLLVRALGAKQNVRKSPTPEIGWTQIEVLKPSALTAGLPSSFYSFSWHLDEVCELPAGMIHLARSESCAIQAYQIEGRPVFGIQFHPEKNLNEATASFFYKPKVFNTKFILHPKQGPTLYDSSVGEIIFKNFLAI